MANQAFLQIRESALVVSDSFSDELHTPAVREVLKK